MREGSPELPQTSEARRRTATATRARTATTQNAAPQNTAPQSAGTPSAAPQTGVLRAPRRTANRGLVPAVDTTPPPTGQSSATQARPASGTLASGTLASGTLASGTLPTPPARAPRPPRTPRATGPVPPVQQTLELSFPAPAQLATPQDEPVASTAAPTIERKAPGDLTEQRGPATGQGMAGASAMPGLPIGPYLTPHASEMPEPDVWLVALATAGGGLRLLEGAGRPGAIRVSRPYGHLRALRPVTPPELFAAGASAGLQAAPVTSSRGSRGLVNSLGSGVLATEGPEAAAPTAPTRLPTQRPAPQIVSAIEVETDAGVFRVERPHSVLGHTDLAWALANLESGEPDSLVPLPRRQLALLLTLLPTPEDPEHPELDSRWGWAHRLKGPWERGPLHPRGRLGRLIAVDPDPTNRGMHRACFEVLGSDEIVWALGVPCYRTGSVYELAPLRRGLSASRWLSWPLAKGAKGRARAGAVEQPDWEIARVVYRVGAPRWPLAGVIEPLGPMGIAG
jgi:hypothetical protein